jgi:hypothetical protein
MNLIKHLSFSVSDNHAVELMRKMTIIVYMLMYLFFIKAFLCTTSPPAE